LALQKDATASISANVAISPSGYADADTATATGNAPHLIYQNLAFTSGTAYTLSVFAKANTSDYIQLVLAGQFSATNYANFDLIKWHNYRKCLCYSKN
jgi:hypothetical protein